MNGYNGVLAVILISKSLFILDGKILTIGEYLFIYNALTNTISLTDDFMGNDVLWK